MSDADRELRDRLEAAQSELKRARSRLDELEGVAADRDTLRSQLELTQADLKQASERLDELEGQSTEELQAALDEVTRDRDLLRQRLEQADKTREQWDHRVSQREAELMSLRAELARVKEVPATAENATPAPNAKIYVRAGLFVTLTLGGALLLLLRSCA